VRAKGKKGLSVRSEDEPQINSFFAAQSKIRIRRGETKQLVVQFMPVSMEPHRCKIIFVDNAVGEFQHELVGEVALPEISGEIKPTQIYVDQKVVHEILVPLRNEQRVQAIQKIEQKLGVKNSKGDGYAADNEFMQVSLAPPISYIAFADTL